MPHPDPERREHAPPEPARQLDVLTREQAAAVTHGIGPLLLIAGPGAGKTRTVIRRTGYATKPVQRGSRGRGSRTVCSVRSGCTSAPRSRTRSRS